MFGLADSIKLPVAAGAGAMAATVLLFAWFSLVTVPQAERFAREDGRLACEAAQDAANLAEQQRQQAVNQSALLRARQRELEQAERADTLQRKLMDLANDVSAMDTDRLCLDPGWVRQLDAIR